MARSQFGGTASDWVFTTYRFAGRELLDLAAATLTFWDAAAGGTRHTDLRDALGNTVTSIPVGADGQIPVFSGPDGVTVMWADAGSGQRVRMITTDATAIAADRQAAQAAKTAAETAAAAVQAVTASNDGIMTAVAKNPASEFAKWQSATFALRNKPAKPGSLSRLMETLVEGTRSVGLTILGDSTGYTSGKTRWPYLLGNWFAAQFPGYAVQTLTWNDSTQSYGAPVVVSGTPSARYATFANSGALIHPGDGTSITGDLDVRVKIDQQPGTAMTLVSRYWAAPNNAWHFAINSNGSLLFQCSSDGTNNALSKNSAILPGLSAPYWVRVTLDVDNGAGGNDLTFYYSTDGVAWTMLGTVITTAGAIASIKDPGAAYPIQIGSYNGASSRYTGKVYEVEVRNGIDGPGIVPRYPDCWDTWSSVAGGVAATFTAKPVLTIVNGSMPGASISYLTDPTRLPKMTPASYASAAIILSCSHNDTRNRGSAYTALWDAWLTALRGRTKDAEIAVMTQNPKLPGVAAFFEAHRARRLDLIGWAARNGLTVIDVYRAFMESATPLTTLVDPDGIHPSDSAGSPLWAETVEAYLLGRQ